MSTVQYIDIHTHKAKKSKEILSLVNLNTENPEIDKNAMENYSIGIHPWNAHKKNLSFQIITVQNYSTHPRVIAIGETGLDRLAKANLKEQELIFRQQLEIAEQLGKPVIIHCVKCFSELLRIRKQSQQAIPWILHAFQKNEQIAQTFLDSGCYLSFGAALLRNSKLQNLFCKIPADRFFLETDDNKEPVVSVYQKAVELKNMEMNELKTIVQTNFKTCFKL